MKSHQEIPDLFGEDDPFAIFQAWLVKAQEHPGIREAAAMTVATCLEDTPHARVVLLKEVTSDGFVFYTNYESQKGRELEANPRACLNFYWDPLALQVRIDGEVEKIPFEQSEAYWNSRPRDSQLSQWISQQSKTVQSREQLESLVQQAEEQFRDQPIPCPKHWGGYLVKPRQFEFWIGRPSRLHDRFRFQKSHGSWKIDRLFP